MTPAVERRVAAVRGRIAARVRDLLPDARVEEGVDGVIVSARGLVRRWVDDPRLSWWRA
jgi:hypothetical protein